MPQATIQPLIPPFIPHNPTTQAYDELQRAFEHFNNALFGGTIPFCLITLQREKRTYGYFSHKRFVHHGDKTVVDEIAMNPAYFAVVPLIEILQTLVHEMAHAWQYHHGKPGRRSYHNKEWANKMESIGLMPSSTGEPGGSRTGEHMADYPIEGGLFLKAAKELISSSFNVSWFDRFPTRISTKERPNMVGGHVPAISDVAMASVLQIQMPAAGRANRSNRLKYRCPSCGVQAWGKPGLSLLCGIPSCNRAALVDDT